MSKGYDVIVADADYTKVKTMVKNYCVVLESLMDEYRKSLKKIAEEAVISGKTHEALITYISYVKQLNGKFDDLGKAFKKCCNKFIQDIDNMDDYLYEVSNKTVRDFTDSEYKKMLGMLKVEDKWYLKILDRADDALKGIGIKWFNAYDVKGKVNGSLKSAHQALLDYNNANKKKVTDIFEGIRGIDVEYGNDFSSRTLQLGSFIFSIIKVIEKCSEIVDPKNGKFTTENMNLELGQLYTLLSEYANTVIQISESTDEITIDEIDNYVNDIRNMEPFNACRGYINEELGDLNGWDTAAMVFYQGKSITLSELTNRFSVPEELSGSEIYEYLSVKKQISEILSKTSQDKIDISKSEEAVNEAKNILEYCAEFRKNPLKETDPKYEEYKKMYDEATAYANGVAEGMGYGVDITNILLDGFANYYLNQKVIQSLQEGMPEGTMTSRVVQDLWVEYQSLWLANIKNILEYSVSTAIKQGLKEAVKLGGKGFSKTFGIVQLAIDISGALTGLSGGSDKKIQYTILNSTTSALADAYRHHFEVVANGSRSVTDIENLNNSFKVLKEAHIKQLDLLAGIANDERNYNRKAYYEYVKQLVSKQTMNSERLKVPTFKEYMAH